MGGDGYGNFDPAGFTTRAHATQVQKNILNAFK